MLTEPGPTYATYTEPTLPTFGGAGSVITDPTFNTRILKVTDSSDSAVKCSVDYSYNNYFNTLNTKIMAFYHSSFYKAKFWDFNTKTFQRSNPSLMTLSIGGIQTAGMTFSNLDPDKVWYSTRNQSDSPVSTKIYSYKVSTDTHTLLKDLTSQALGTTSYLFQMSVSKDDNRFSFTIIDSGGSGVGYVVYEASTDTVLLRATGLSINEVRLDKTGRYLWVVKVSGHSVIDLNNGNSETAVTGLPNGTHYAMGNAYNMMCTAGTQQIAKRDLTNPNTNIMLTPTGVWSYANQSDHFSSMGPDGWVEGSRYHTTGGGVSNAFDNEIVMLKSDGSQNVRRVCHHRAVFSSYEDAPFGALSQDGSYVMFSSNWGNGGGRYDVYIAEILAPLSTSTIARGKRMILV